MSSNPSTIPNDYKDKNKNTIPSAGLDCQAAFKYLQDLSESYNLINTSNNLINILEASDPNIRIYYASNLWSTLKQDLLNLNHNAVMGQKLKQFNQLMEAVSIECKKQSLQYDGKVPEDHNPSLLSFIFELMNKPYTDLEKNIDEITIVLLLFNIILIQESPNTIQLSKYNQYFKFTTPFFDNKLSVIDNVRHSICHSDVELKFDSEIISLLNRLKNLNTTTTKQQLIKDYMGVIDAIDLDFNGHDNIININDQIRKLQNIKKITNKIPMEVCLLLFVIITYESYYASSRNLFERYSKIVSTSISFDDLLTITVNNYSVSLREFRNYLGHDDDFCLNDGTVVFNKTNWDFTIENLVECSKQWMILLKLPLLRTCVDIIYACTEQLVKSSIRS